MFPTLVLEIPKWQLHTFAESIHFCLFELATLKVVLSLMQMTEFLHYVHLCISDEDEDDEN